MTPDYRYHATVKGSPMLRSAALSGVALGLVIAGLMSRVDRPAPIAPRASQTHYTRLQTGAVIPAGQPSHVYLTEFHGRQYAVSWAALDIPCWMVGGETLSINGAVSKRYVSE